MLNSVVLAGIDWISSTLYLLHLHLTDSMQMNCVAGDFRSVHIAWLEPTKLLRSEGTYMVVGGGAIIVLAGRGILVCCPRGAGGQAEEHKERENCFSLAFRLKEKK